MSHFRPDGGGEYSSDDLKDWLKERGIKYDPSTARTPEQNGISERAIQTLMSRVKPMLKHANMSVTYWCVQSLRRVIWTTCWWKEIIQNHRMNFVMEVSPATKMS